MALVETPCGDTGLMPGFLPRLARQTVLARDDQCGCHAAAEYDDQQDERAEFLSLDLAGGFHEERCGFRIVARPWQRLFQRMENDSALLVAVVVAEGFRLAHQQ